MITVVSSIPNGVNFIFAETFKNSSMSVVYKNDKNMRFVSFGKTSIDDFGAVQFFFSSGF